MEMGQLCMFTVVAVTQVSLQVIKIEYDYTHTPEKHIKKLVKSKHHL